jgi:hypothetical protein
MNLIFKWLSGGGKKALFALRAALKGLKSLKNLKLRLR